MSLIIFLSILFAHFQAFGGITMEAYVALHQADELQAIINEIKVTDIVTILYVTPREIFNAFCNINSCICLFVLVNSFTLLE